MARVVPRLLSDPATLLFKCDPSVIGTRRRAPQETPPPPPPVSISASTAPATVGRGALRFVSAPGYDPMFVSESERRYGRWFVVGNPPSSIDLGPRFVLWVAPTVPGAAVDDGPPLLFSRPYSVVALPKPALYGVTCAAWSQFARSVSLHLHIPGIVALVLRDYCGMFPVPDDHLELEPVFV